MTTADTLTSTSWSPKAKLLPASKLTTRILNLFNRHFSTLRSDGKSNPNGSEYYNLEMTKYCQSHGIHQQSSCAHSPEENSRAGRVNRALVEGANALLQASHLPKFFWAFAILTCRSPHSAITFLHDPQLTLTLN
jgi:hypothetical protein